MDITGPLPLQLSIGTESRDVLINRLQIAGVMLNASAEVLLASDVFDHPKPVSL
jgi:hypothetical protein